MMASVGSITNGKFDKSELYVWWGDQKEYERVKKLSTATNNPIIFLKRQERKVLRMTGRGRETCPFFLKCAARPAPPD